ncbi:MAG: hypothetical protein ACYDEQ_09475 [Desulfocucumaceae bacterium]
MAGSEILGEVKREASDAAGNIRTWIDSIKKGSGLWDGGSKRRRTRRGSPGAGRGIR